ncbi:hypothetical protein [Nocardioides antri]|uniref:Uncharacterized protein n=1 Tax=Nocardioides antri TaxID=2607659 RepID=A0A5B1M7V0_9ACTN|nr:hypothetical protein [Nocardioides antri]KAA1428873.1 hypothetical protein F0U47_01250 [Nocardioides antri]
MNDLDQLLRDAADSGDGDRLDPRELLSSGRRRVRNRRAAVAGGVAAAVVAAAAVVTWLPTGDDRPDPSDVVDGPGDHSSTYEEVRIPVEEVERRCSIVLNGINGTGDLSYVTGRAPDGTAVSGTEADHFVETREGWTAYLRPVGERWPAGEPRYRSDAGGPRQSVASGSAGGDGGGDGDGEMLVGEMACVIPQADLVAAIPGALYTPLPEDAGADQVVELCSAQTGYDLRGWEVLLVRSFEFETVALTMSENGYVATCTVWDEGWLSDLRIDPEPYLDEDGDPLPADPDDLAVATSFGSGTFTEARVLPGLPDGYVVSFSAGGEVIAETTTHRGAYAIEFPVPEEGPVIGRVTDPEGTVLWEDVVDH